MSEVSLDLFKKHVRADDFADDDEYLEHLLETAEVTVVRATNRTLDELKEMCGGSFPKPLQHAEMLLAAHWYNQRESVSTVQMHEVPGTLLALVKPWTRLDEGDDDCGENEIQA